MLKSKILIAAAALLLVGFTSCGIFKKGCGCPPVSKVAKPASKTARNNSLA